MNSMKIKSWFAYAQTAVARWLSGIIASGLSRSQRDEPCGRDTCVMLWANGSLLAELTQAECSVGASDTCRVSGVLLLMNGSDEAEEVFNFAVTGEEVLLDVVVAGSGKRFQSKGKIVGATLVAAVGRHSSVRFDFVGRKHQLQ